MKHVCDRCGYNYKEDGLAVDLSVTANWNEEKNRYEFKKSFLDIEIKCPNCYGYVDETVRMLED